MADGLGPHLEAAYETLERNPALHAFMKRHGIESAGILTVYEDERARLLTEHLYERIEGKVVVEIGAGIGLLSLHMSMVAKQVFAIEACPVWTYIFMSMWMEKKPKNLTFVFGAAEELAGHLQADVAVFCTHSGRKAMPRAAQQLAPTVIDVHRELIPLDRETELLREAKA